jgi:chemotaxis protein CheD
MMISQVIGIGECCVSNDPRDVLVSHALGSCIAVLIYDPVVRVAGLLHYMLPESGLDPAKAAAKPFLFADTGIHQLFRRAHLLGAVRSRLVVMAAGGAQMMAPDGSFNIGKRNQLAMRDILLKAGVVLRREEVGGVSARTVRIEVATGRVWLRTSSAGETELTATAAERRVSHGV